MYSPATTTFAGFRGAKNGFFDRTRVRAKGALQCLTGRFELHSHVSRSRIPCAFPYIITTKTPRRFCPAAEKVRRAFSRRSGPLQDFDSRNGRHNEALLEAIETLTRHDESAHLFHELAQRLREVVQFDIISVMLHDPGVDLMRLHILESDRPMNGEFRSARGRGLL